MSKLTRKQKIQKQREWSAERVMGPIRDAVDRGDLVITPVQPQEPDPLSGREYCPRCVSGPRQPQDVRECPDCGYPWSGPPLLGTNGVTE